MKKSLIDMLVNGKTPDDYLKREADELASVQRHDRAVSVSNEAKEWRAPGLRLFLMLSGLTLGMMGIGYVLIF